MSLIYSKPEINHQAIKPVTAANKGFPYNALADHRRFEELIYSVYSQEIRGGSWKNIYDNISLLQGVRERGRDCVLYRDDKITGLIQCKHSIYESERISRPECIREIIKFALHAINDKSLISDVNDFTYFIAVSHGFSEPALTLILNFKIEIFKEKELKEWAKDIISANNTLRLLKFETIEVELLSILAAIKVKTILPQDLDLLLSAVANQNIIGLFFEVKTIYVDRTTVNFPNSSIQSITSSMPIDEILNKFRQSSFDLENYTDQFEGLPGSNIPRSETQHLLKWILDPIPENNNGKTDSKLPIALLAGDAGIGKSVILKELLLELRSREIPVIGIKADRFYVKSIREFNEKIDLGDSIEKVILTIKKQYDKVVILIDQIDALAQSVSISTEYIDTFTKVICKLADFEGVRIVVSCRIYDLNYDNELKFYNNQEVFKVDLLTEENVNTVLEKLGINLSIVPKSLLELLRTPNHLNVFCKIQRSTIAFNEIRSLYDLYNLLWRTRIVAMPQHSKANGLRCQELVYELASLMYSSQKILLSISPILIDKYLYELEHLKSNGILTEKSGEVHFFHQTFYDYAFARSFVESDKEVIDYLLENNQAIHIRSSLKMILGFLREKDPKKYIKFLNEVLFGDVGRKRVQKSIKNISSVLKNYTTLTKVLFSAIHLVATKPKLADHINELRLLFGATTYRFHLKLLLIDLLGFEKEPTQEEQQIATKIIANRRLSRFFFESASSSIWFKFLFDYQHIQRLIPKENYVDKVTSQIDSNRVKNIIDIVTVKKIRVKNDELRLNICFQLLRKFLPKERSLVLLFLKESPPFEAKKHFIARILYFLKIWDDDSAYLLFEQYQKEIIQDSHTYYTILADAAHYNLKWVANWYLITAKNKITNIERPLIKTEFDHRDETLLKKIIEIDSETAFDILLKIVSTTIENASNTKREHSKVVYSDLAYFMFDRDKNHRSNGQKVLLLLLIEVTEKLAREKSKLFDDFIVSTINSNSETLLKILIYGLRVAPNHYSKNCFELIVILNGKGAFQYDGDLLYQVRALIKASYIYLTTAQKDFINLLVVSLVVKSEFKIYHSGESKNHVLNKFGRLQFLLLKSIPRDEIINNLLLKKKFFELERKFPDLIDIKPNSTRGGVVGPPLSQVAYEKMDLKNWENSFRKFAIEEVYFSDALKGSLLEHSRAFESAVIARPNYFFPLLEKLVLDSTINPYYFIRGLDGLKSAKYNPFEVKKLFIKAIQNSHFESELIHLIWVTDYFHETNSIDNEIVGFLCQCAIHSSYPVNEKEIGSSFVDAINTVRGAAAYRIPCILTLPDSKELIFETLSKVAEDKSISVRTAMINRLAYLMNLDETRTVDLFLKATKDFNGELAKQSMWSLSYLAGRHFKLLKKYIKETINVESIRPDIATILAVSWMNGNKGSKKLLKQAVFRNTKAKSKMVNVAINFLRDENENTKRKAVKLYIRYLNNDDQDIVNEYSTAFFDLPVKYFMDYLPILKKYSKSKVVKKSPGDFFEYLVKCSKAHPKECLDLLSSFHNYDKPDFTKGGYYSDEPIKVLLGAYNSLRSSNTLNAALINKSMVLFDKMLIDERFRTEANKALANA